MNDYEWLRLSDLLVDPEVQRRFDPAHAKRIQAEYDPLQFGLGHASLRSDGRYYILDAQHRVNAGVSAGFGDTQGLFRVYRDLTLAQEAELFMKLQRNRKPPNALDLFRLSVKAGSVAHCDVKRIVESFGLQIASHQREGGVSAVRALLDIYQGKVDTKSAVQTPSSALPKGQLLSRALHILTTAWGKDRNAFDGILLKGVAALLHKHGVKIDAQRLAKTLAKSGTAMQAIGGIKGLQSLSRKTPTRAAIEYLEGVYNRGRSDRLGGAP